MSEKLTFEKVWAMFQEDREKSAKEWAEMCVRMEASSLETERIMKASSLEVDRQMAETDQKIKEVSQQLGWIGNNNGAAAENYFYNSFAQSKRFGNEQFDYAEPNVRGRLRSLHDEYDIVLYNGNSIGIIEVKYAAKPRDIAQTLNKPATFRQLFPVYADFTFYLGLASLVFDSQVEAEVLDAGIAVIKQVGENMVVLDDRVKKF